MLTGSAAAVNTQHVFQVRRACGPALLRHAVKPERSPPPAGRRREQQSHILTSPTSCTCEEEPKGLWTTVERVYRPHETWNPPLLCQTHADPPGAGSASLS